jgi:GntR family transcriptional regulator
MEQRKMQYLAMTHFGLVLQPGQSIFDQLVSAAQKAILSGELTEGQAFPSVRTLAADLKDPSQYCA